MPSKGFNKAQDEIQGNIRARMNELIRILEETREPVENIKYRAPELTALADTIQAFIGEAQTLTRRNYRKSIVEINRYLGMQ